MKTKLCVTLLAVFIALPGLSRAASEKECAIWLCLPVGFGVPGCGGAQSAMYERLFKGKTPAPSFPSCTAESSGSSNSSTFTIERGNAALIGDYVVAGKLVTPISTIVDDTVCYPRDVGSGREHETPRGCTTTLQSVRMFENGVQTGLTYYRSNPDVVKVPSTGNIYPANAIPQEVIDSTYQ